MSSFRSLSSALRAPGQARAHAVARRQLLPPAQLQSFFHSSPASRLPYKDDQDRESVKPKSTEGSLSGTDGDAAASDAAFDPSTTGPEEAKDQADKGSGGNPLETSGAKPSKSKPLGEDGGGETHDVTKQEKRKSSKGHSPKKQG